VASARPAGAGLFNPALLSAPQGEWQDDFALTLPSVSGRLPQAQRDSGLLADQLEELGGQTLRAGVRHNLGDDTGPQGAEEETLYTAGLAPVALGPASGGGGAVQRWRAGGSLELGFAF